MKNNKKVIVFIILVILAILFFIIKASDKGDISQPKVQDAQKTSRVSQDLLPAKKIEESAVKVDNEATPQFEEVRTETPFSISVTQVASMNKDSIAMVFVKAFSPRSFEEGRFYMLPANDAFHANLNSIQPMTQDQWAEVVLDLEGSDKQGIVFHFGYEQWKAVKESDAFHQLLTDISQQKEEIKLIVIRGHTDAKGTDEYNLALSRKRALEVAQEISYLPVMIDAVGEQDPISSNEITEGRAKNRRVEFFIILNQPKES